MKVGILIWKGVCKFEDEGIIRNCQQMFLGGRVGGRRDSGSKNIFVGGKERSDNM